jgi:hypothetical protein
MPACISGCNRTVAQYGIECNVCKKLLKRQHPKPNLDESFFPACEQNDFWNHLNEPQQNERQPPSKKPRTNKSGDSGNLGRQSSHRHHAGSSRNPNYSSGAPPAAVPPLKNPAQQHRSISSVRPSVSYTSKVYACEICGLSFRKKKLFDIHMNIIHQKKQSYQCLHCPRIFKDKSNCTRHIKIVHKKELPYSCDHCSVSFGHKIQLTRHIKKMHGIDPSATNRPPANQRESSGSRDRPPTAQPRPSR